MSKAEMPNLETFQPDLIGFEMYPVTSPLRNTD